MKMNRGRPKGTWKWRHATEHDVDPDSVYIKVGDPVIDIAGHAYKVDLKDWEQNSDGTISYPWTMKVVEVTENNLYELSKLLKADVVHGWKTENNFFSYESAQKTYPQAFLVSNYLGVLSIGDVLALDNRGWKTVDKDMIEIGEEIGNL